MSFFLNMVLLSCICFECAYAKTDVRSYSFLDNLAQSAGTDKSSLWHNYTKLYAKLFASFKNNKIKFLEIGISEGNSVELWERYFPKAEMHFIDISSAAIKYQPVRAQYHFLDQSNSIELKSFIDKVGGDFDVIIDDGGHTMDQQKVSFNVLFPYVKSGGMYIIEDLSTSYWASYGGGPGEKGAPELGVDTTTEMLKQMIDDVNYTGGKMSCADFNKVPKEIVDQMTYNQAHIESIHFYSNICVIFKR